MGSLYFSTFHKKTKIFLLSSLFVSCTHIHCLLYNCFLYIFTHTSATNVACIPQSKLPHTRVAFCMATMPCSKLLGSLHKTAQRFFFSQTGSCQAIMGIYPVFQHLSLAHDGIDMIKILSYTHSYSISKPCDQQAY